MLVELFADGATSDEIGVPIASSEPLEKSLIANDDFFSILEDSVLEGNLLSDNGNGADVQADNVGVTVYAVNGISDSTGQDILLDSGAILNVQAQGEFNFDPNGQYQGLAVGQTATETFNYSIQDESGQTGSASAVITIQGENDAPIVERPLEIAIDEDADSVVFVSLITDSYDPDDDVIGAFDLNLISGDDSGVTQIVDSLFVDASAYRALNPGETEVIQYKYSIVDGLGGETPQTATIAINGTIAGPEVINPVQDQTFKAYTPFIFEIPTDTFDRVDASVLELSVGLVDEQPLPSWLNFDQDTNQLSGYATVDDLSQLDLELTATDSDGDRSKVTFNLGIALPLNVTVNKFVGDSSANDIRGTRSNDSILGKANSDTLRGIFGDDNLVGGASSDFIYGGRGDDVLIGNHGHDVLRAGKDDDLLLGGENDDNINGGLGNDTLDGGAGNDTLWGSHGNDVIILNQGGEDVVNAGIGNDTFVLTKASSGHSDIRRFELEQDTFLLTQGLSVEDVTITPDGFGNTKIEYQGASIFLRRVANLSSESFTTA